MEAHPGPLKVYLLAVKAHPGALEARSGAVEAHPGALHAHLEPSMRTLEPFMFTLGLSRLTLDPCRFIF